MTNNPDNDERLLDHSYDGIQEFDNPMPRWWVWIFWATIAFSFAYWLDFSGKLRGPGRIQEYEAQLAAAELRWPKPTGGPNESALAALVSDRQALAMGQDVYAANCAVCHRADGGGLIGPNLTDEYWLHGGTLVEIHVTINDGVLAKGMPGWSKILKPDQVDAVTAYIASLHGSNPKNAKAPQGEPTAVR